MIGLSKVLLAVGVLGLTPAPSLAPTAVAAALPTGTVLVNDADIAPYDNSRPAAYPAFKWHHGDYDGSTLGTEGVKPDAGKGLAAPDGYRLQADGSLTLTHKATGLARVEYPLMASNAFDFKALPKLQDALGDPAGPPSFYTAAETGSGGRVGLALAVGCRDEANPNASAYVQGSTKPDPNRTGSFIYGNLVVYAAPTSAWTQTSFPSTATAWSNVYDYNTKQPVGSLAEVQSTCNGTTITRTPVVGYVAVTSGADSAANNPAEASTNFVDGVKFRSATFNFGASTATAVTRLNPGAAVASGFYELRMQSDGNLVIYGPNGAVWNSGTFVPGSYVTRQGDGNLVMYAADGDPLWFSNTFASDAAAALGPDGVLRVANGSKVLWASDGSVGTAVTVPNRIVNGLETGQSEVSTNGRYTLIMQSDGNLVIYDNARQAALWSSGTHGVSRARLVVQGDGNVVIYSTRGAEWHAQTYGNPGARPVFQGDGNLVVYGNGVLWDAFGYTGRQGQRLRTP